MREVSGSSPEEMQFDPEKHVPEAEDGGFITKEAAENDLYADKIARIAERAKTLVNDQSQTVDKIDVLHQEAKEIDKLRDKIIKEGFTPREEDYEKLPRIFEQDKELALAMLKTNTDSGLHLQWFRGFSEKLLGDKQFMLQAVEINPYSLGMATAEIRNDIDVVLAASEQNVAIIQPGIVGPEIWDKIKKQVPRL